MEKTESAFATLIQSAGYARTAVWLAKASLNRTTEFYVERPGDAM